MRPPLIPQPIPLQANELDHIKLLKTLYNTLVEYRDPQTGRIIISIFMCLPSRKDFPEYFEIIQRPISMYEIRKRIENGHYESEEPCLNDFRLMFNNCRTFNEDGSMIFQDAVRLEELLFDKYDQYTSENGGNVKRIKTSSSPTKVPTVPTSFAASTTSIDTSTPVRRSKKQTDPNSNLSQTVPRRYNKNKNSPSSPAPKNLYNKNDKNHSFSNHNHQSSTPYVQTNDQHSYSNNHHNGLASDADSNSNSNQYSSCNGNTNDSFITNHSFHNDASIDSNSNLSIGPLTPSVPTNDKPTKRLKRDPDAPKRRLLTGYIIYAAEVRKEYVDKHPNQDFGFISRLIGNDWKALPKDLRVKYDQRALIHNKKMREKALRDSMLAQSNNQSQFPYYNSPRISHDTPMTNGSSTPRLTKKRLAKLAKEQARMQNSSTPYLNHDSSFSSPARHQDRPSHGGLQASYSSFRHIDNQRHPYSTQQNNYGQQSSGKMATVEMATQTAPFRFVEPSTTRRHAHAENFRRYIESLNVPNLDLLAEETACYDRPPEPIETWLGAGHGRHGSAEAALWALRDFMLQDSETMRMNMQPYLCYQ